VRIHSGLGVSDSTKKPNIRTRLTSEAKNCLLNRRSPYTKKTLDKIDQNRLGYRV